MPDSCGPFPTRRRFLRSAAGPAGLAASIGPAHGKLEADEPGRWSNGGPFSQIPSALIAVIKTDEGITGFGMGAGGSIATEIIHGHLRHLLVGADPLRVDQR